jgi:hypothetical protein
VAQHNNRQPPQLDPALARAAMEAMTQPTPPQAIAYLKSEANPCATQAVQAVPFGDKLIFYIFGGFTAFEVEALNMARIMASRTDPGGMYGSEAAEPTCIADRAVELVEAVLKRCQSVNSPYQGQKPQVKAE